MFLEGLSITSEVGKWKSALLYFSDLIYVNVLEILILYLPCAETLLFSAGKDGANFQPILSMLS